MHCTFPAYQADHCMRGDDHGSDSAYRSFLYRYTILYDAYGGIAYGGDSCATEDQPDLFL